jgi:hypothetical protein
MSDDGIAAALAGMFAAIDPIPPAALAAALDAYDWRDLDLRLAELTFETEADQLLTHTRGSAPRLLTFAVDDVTIDLEVAIEGGEVRVLGQLDPPQAAEIRAEWDGGGALVESDAAGRFQIDDLPAGRLRIVVVIGTTPIATEWFHG